MDENEADENYWAYAKAIRDLQTLHNQFHEMVVATGDVRMMEKWLEFSEARLLANELGGDLMEYQFGTEAMLRLDLAEAKAG